MPVPLENVSIAEVKALLGDSQIALVQRDKTIARLEQELLALQERLKKYEPGKDADGTVRTQLKEVPKLKMGKGRKPPIPTPPAPAAETTTPGA